MIPTKPVQHRIALDLTKSHFRRRHGDIMVWGTWYRNAESQWRPCLVLTPAFRERGHEEVQPFIVPVDTAFLWSEDGYGDPRHAARGSFEAARSLGLNAYSAMTCYRIASVVRDHLGDLLHIPPKPPADRVTVAEIIRIDPETGRETYSEMTDHV